MPTNRTLLTVGETATRSGVAGSALRYYESIGLIAGIRTPGNQRRYHRSILRRISVIQVAQSLGLSLQEIGVAFEGLPEKRTPTKADWGRLSRNWRTRLEEKIAELERLRDKLDGCIGCGCLSLRSCALFNNDDRAALSGPGARFLQAQARPETR